jgi:hypothetical protein
VLSHFAALVTTNESIRNVSYAGFTVVVYVVRVASSMARTGAVDVSVFVTDSVIFTVSSFKSVAVDSLVSVS